MNNQVVIPQQNRSIEKRNKLIEVGFQLFSERGYYNTNTAEIAKEAGVSTGIFYRYFTDKKALYLEIFQKRSAESYQIIIDKIKNLDSKSDFGGFISACIDYIVSTHDSAKSVHEEFEAMAHYDSDVAELFQNVKESAIAEIASSLKALQFNTNHTHEKIHLIIDLIESYCHEVVYNKEECKDYGYLKQTIIDTCLFLLQR